MARPNFRLRRLCILLALVSLQIFVASSVWAQAQPSPAGFILEDTNGNGTRDDVPT